MPFTVDKRKKSVFLKGVQNIPRIEIRAKKSQWRDSMENMYSCTSGYRVITHNGKG